VSCQAPVRAETLKKVKILPETRNANLTNPLPLIQALEAITHVTSQRKPWT
jgi:hypothetical protein